MEYNFGRIRFYAGPPEVVVCIAALILCFVISTAVSRYTTYRMGYELLMLNGLLTYCGLYGTSYDNENA